MKLKASASGINAYITSWDREQPLGNVSPHAFLVPSLIHTYSAQVKFSLYLTGISRPMI